MPRMIAWRALAAVLAGCAAGNGREAAPDLYRNTVLRTVSVERLSAEVPIDEISSVPADGFGSGVLLRHDRILTAAHVVEGAKTLRVRIPVLMGDPPSTMVQIALTKVIALDRETDLALLEIASSSELPAAPLAAEPPEVNEQVYVFDACPYPHDVARGCALNPLQINVSGQPGSSGAGVWVLRNGRYELAGIVKSHIAREPVVTNVWSQQNGKNRVNVNVVQEQPKITNIVHSSFARNLIEGAK